MLRILLLGPPSIYNDETLLQIPRRVPRAMLFYLACQDQWISRSDLAYVFWGGKTEEESRLRLRETLGKLRPFLPDPTVLVTDQERVWLDHKRVYVDVADFQELLRQTNRAVAQLPESQPLPETILQQLLRAAHLWRGARFMAGVTLPESTDLEYWWTQTSQRLEYAYTHILERLAKHAAASGDLDVAIYWARQALKVDMLNLDMHLGLLKWLDELGRRSEATSYCGYLKELYEREEGGELPDAIQTLCQEVQERNTQPRSNNVLQWAALPGMQAPFIGHENVLKELHQAFHHGGQVVITGETGSGKSRLMQELFMNLEPAPRLLVAAGHPLECDLPFQPLADMLRHAVLAEEWQKLDAVWARPLSLILPELVTLHPGVVNQPVMVKGDQLPLIFEGLRQMLLRLAKNQRLILFLDGAQWVDEQTFSALAYLVERHFFDENGLLVIAARNEEPNPHLEQYLDVGLTSLTALRIKLLPLMMEDCAELTRAVLGRAVSRALVERLLQDCGGNPYFLLETLRILLELSLDLDSPQTAARLPLASSIHAVTHERLRRLSPNAVLVLNAAAVVGNEFTLDILEPAAALGPEQVTAALEDLERAGLIRQASDIPPAGGYVFIHHKVREVLLMELSPARKRLLHLRAARAIEATRDNPLTFQAKTLATHYEEAGELQQAFLYWLLAAQHARRMFAFSEAGEAYHHAERLLLQVEPRLSDQALYQFYAGWGEMAADHDQPEVMQRVYSAMLSIGEQRRSSRLKGSALSGLANAAIPLNLLEQGLLYLERALPFLNETKDQFELVEAYNRQGALQMRLNQFEQAIQSFQRAQELAQNGNDERIIEARFHTLYQTALTHLLTGWPEKTLTLAEEMIQLGQKLPFTQGLARAHLLFVLAGFYLGKYWLALEHYRAGLEITRSIENWRMAGFLLGAGARVELSLGHTDECWRAARQALSLAERYEYPDVAMQANGALGDLCRLLESYPKAIEYYQRGIEAGRDNYHKLDNMYRLGLTMAQNWQMDRGIELLDRAIAISRESGFDLVLIPALISLGQTYYSQRNEEGRLEVLREVEEKLIDRSYPGLRFTFAHLKNQVGFLKGDDLDEARKYARKYVQLGKELNNPWMELQGERLLAEMIESRGRGKREAIQRCLAILDEISENTQESALQSMLLFFRIRVTSTIQP